MPYFWCFIGKSCLLKSNWPYYLLHLIALVVLLSFHRYTISSPDTAHYLFISRYYLEGEFWQAVNSHWSPMVSWLLIPILALRFEPLLAFFLLNAAVSFVALWLWLEVLKKATLPKWLEWVAVLLVIPVLITGVVVLTPDFLTATLLLVYFHLVTKQAFGDHLKSGLLAGVTGGFIFLCKSYGLPFFVVHFTAIHFLLFLFGKRDKQPMPKKGVLGSYLGGMLGFILVITPWVIALSLKFGTFTYSNAGKYNIVNYGPEGGQHIYYNRLIDPDTKYTRYDAFEEPSMFLTDWTPLESTKSLTYYLKRIGPNLSSLYYLSYLRDIGILVALCLFLFFLYGKALSRTRLLLLLQAGLVVAIYTSGYLLLLIKARYLWIDYLLATFCLWILVAHLLESGFHKKLVGFWVVAASIMILVNTQDMFRGYVVYRIYGEKLYNLQQSVAELPLEDKDVVSNIARNGMTHSAMNNLFRYYSKFRHWGHLVDENLKTEGLKQAYDNNLDYFFLWNPPEYLDSVFSDVPVVLRDTTVGLTIYDLKSNSQ